MRPIGGVQPFFFELERTKIARGKHLGGPFVQSGLLLVVPTPTSLSSAVVAASSPPEPASEALFFVLYNTPEFTLKRIKDEEAERRCECGCYLCTYVRDEEQWSGALEWWDAD